MAFRGVDYFCVDSLFGEEELLVRRTARRFADERILPLIRDCYREARFPCSSGTMWRWRSSARG
jgi:glutaryl-CoA dehydrogenase